METKPKILFIDIETFPNVAWVWGKYEQNVIEFKQETCIATFAAKWLNGPMVAKGLCDYKGYKAESYDDKAIVAELWELLHEADILVAHNGDAFDFKVMTARFLFHEMPPPAPYKTVDTKKVAKRVARFNSNRLDDLGRYFGEGRKIKTTFALWQGCIEGDAKSWKKMLTYNKQDVLLLEKVYKRLLPYTADHPNQGLWTKNAVCPKCGGKKMQSRGFARTSTRLYRRLQCQDCGGWMKAIGSEKGQGVQVTNCAG